MHQHDQGGNTAPPREPGALPRQPGRGVEIPEDGLGEKAAENDVKENGNAAENKPALLYDKFHNSYRSTLRQMVRQTGSLKR